MQMLYYVAFGVTIFCFAALGIYLVLQRKSAAHTSNRLLQVTGQQPMKRGSTAKAARQQLLQSLHQLRTHLGVTNSEKLVKRFAAASIRNPNAAEMYLTIRIVAPALGLLVGSFIHKDTFLAMMVLAGAGYLGPDIWLERKIKSRRHKIHRSMPDAIDLLVICVDAGLGLDQAMLRVGQELAVSHPEINQEFLQINREQRAGRPRIEAWQGMADRTQLPDNQDFVSLPVEAETFRTADARALNSVSGRKPLKKKPISEEKAAKTSVKLLFPLVLFIFPCIFIVLLGPAAISISKSLGHMHIGH